MYNIVLCIYYNKLSFPLLRLVPPSIQHDSILLDPLDITVVFIQ